MPKKLEERVKYIKARVFDTTKPNFVFPEENHDEIKNRENFGITFSGGGTRAVSMAMGQLRALNSIGLLNRAKYISAVSGGSWASMPFMFLDEKLSDDVFWGPYIKPEQISSQDLDYAPDYSLTKAIKNATFIDKIISEIDFGHDLYAQIVAKIILAPFNIGNQKKFFTLNQNSLQKILSLNPALKAEDFYLVNTSKNRPFYIVGGAMLRPNYTRYLLEMTPLYVGVNAFFPKSTSKDRFDIGGGYIEPHGFNTFAPDQIQDDVVYTLLGKTKNMYNLGDMVGTSSAAPALFTNRFGIRWLGFPQFKYWCNFSNPIDTDCIDYDFGDGGIMENLGIMPLLKRKVKKIIAFVNCETELRGPDDTLEQITNSIPALFYKLNNQYGDKNFDENIVFANQKDKYLELVNDLLDKKKKGLPLIHTNTYKVTKQPHYNITDEYDVEIMWIYNETVFDWQVSLQPEIKQLLANSKMFKGFPHYKTFMQNPPDALALKPPQVNLLSQLCSWIIETNQDLFEGFLKQ